jgi:hypothetical protein
MLEAQRPAEERQDVCAAMTGSHPAWAAGNSVVTCVTVTAMAVTSSSVLLTGHDPQSMQDSTHVGGVITHTEPALNETCDLSTVSRIGRKSQRSGSIKEDPAQAGQIASCQSPRASTGRLSRDS